MPRLVSVAVPVPFLPALTYRVPDTGPVPAPGVRVRVPLGTRVVTGCVIGEVTETEPPAAKDLIECLDAEPMVPRAVLDLVLWVADYYACGPGDAIGAAMPPLAWLRDAHEQSASRFKTTRVVHLTEVGRRLVDAEESPRLGQRQREALAFLQTASGGVTAAALAGKGVTGDTLRRLERREAVRFETQQVDRDPLAGPEWDGDAATQAFALTSEQQTALARLTTWAIEDRFRVALLHGVTGSGKTAVYLRLADEVRRRGRRVLVLVPEIALTPAVVRAFRATSGRVAVQHSGLSDGERHDQWHRIRRGQIDVVVGTRSAVFAPLDKLGLVIVDEEHDASYKQEDSPRYSGRDVAVMRGQQAGALVVLGSATPSMESYQNVMTDRYERVVLAERVLARPLAAVSVVDMREEVASQGPDVVLSRRLQEGLEQRIRDKQQALVLLNRRGYATAVLCRQCGDTLSCPNCSVSLTLHRAAGRVRCHYCDYSAARPARCPHCAGAFLERVGFGTERIEREIATQFPDAVVGRLDRDTARRRGAAARMLARFARREIDVLVGTQMVAKGHDFPAVTLVGVVSADVGLGLADFRAAERTFQLLTQVAGRAGRGEIPGEAIVQTFHPDHYSIGFACQQAYEPFFEAEMRFRRSMRYPPVVAMVNIIVRASTLARAFRDASGLADALRASNTHERFEILGPAPAPVTRVRGEHRVQIFLKGMTRRAMREAVQAALDAEPALRRRVTIDVDPLSML